MLNSRAFAIALLPFVVAPLAGQRVAGTVALSDSTPAGGVIVIASDARGATAGRALTSANGAFTLRLPTAGRYELKLLRIGYHPTRGPTISVADSATETVRIVFAAEAVVLSAVAVSDQRTCRVNADTGLMVARVWEEARKAMLSTQLSTDGAPLVADWIEYDRTLDSAARLVRQQHVRTSRNPTTHAFRSRPAAELDSMGYVVDDNGSTTYYAPDADVLLSDEFVGAHCFRLEPPRTVQANLIGVAFEPTRARRERRDIEGTLWVDQSTAELRSLEFRYTNLSETAASVGAGGGVTFLRLSDGNWLVSRWSLRMPRLAALDRRPDAGTRRVIMSSTNAVVRAVQVAGGEVTRVTRRDSIVYVATGSRLVVHAVARDTLVRAAGATLVLDGTDYTATADQSGRITLSPVLAGRYHARLHTPLMDSLGVPPVEGDVESVDGTHVDTLALPSSADLLLKACPRDSVRHGEGMLRGVTRTERAVPVPHAAVTVTWQSNVSIVGMAGADRLAWSEQTLGSLTDDAGHWRICGVPRQVALVVRLVSDSGSDARKARLQADEPFGAVDLVAHREVGALNREAKAAIGEMSRPRALVELVVRDISGAALPDATLEIRPPSGPARTVVTGPSGRALLPDVAPGLVTVRARRIGFKEGRLAVSVEAGRNTVPIVLSQVAMPMLDTVRIIGDRLGRGRLDEFETRRLNQSATASFTRADIVKRNPVDLWQMLSGVPSIRIVDTSGVTAESARSKRALPDGSTRPCYLAIMVDGQIKNPTPGHDGFDLRFLPPPEDVHGVEIFAGPASIPLQYGGTGDGRWCGMIAVWTR